MAEYVQSKRRDQFLQAMKLGAVATYKILGWGATDIGIEYETDEETKKFVTQRSGHTTNKGYTLSSSVEQEVFTDDPLFAEIDKIRKNLTIGQGAKGKLLNVNLYDSELEQPASVSGEEFAIEVVVNSFAGPAEDPLSISYTINYQGSPVIGTVALTYEPDGDITFVFTKGEAGV